MTWLLQKPVDLRTIQRISAGRATPYAFVDRLITFLLPQCPQSATDLYSYDHCSQCASPDSPLFSSYVLLWLTSFSPRVNHIHTPLSLGQSTVSPVASANILLPFLHECSRLRLSAVPALRAQDQPVLLALSISYFTSGASKFNHCPGAATESIDFQRPDCLVSIFFGGGCDGTLFSLELIFADLSILIQRSQVLQSTPNTGLTSFVHTFLSRLALVILPCLSLSFSKIHYPTSARLAAILRRA